MIMFDFCRYPPARVWGCPTTGMWVFKLGAERAKRMLLTGDLIDGKTALQMGLVSYAVPASKCQILGRVSECHFVPLVIGSNDI